MRTKEERKILQRNALRTTRSKGLSDTKSHKSSEVKIVTKNKKLYQKTTFDIKISM